MQISQEMFLILRPFSDSHAQSAAPRLAAAGHSYITTPKKQGQFQEDLQGPVLVNRIIISSDMPTRFLLSNRLSPPAADKWSVPRLLI